MLTGCGGVNVSISAHTSPAYSPQTLPSQAVSHYTPKPTPSQTIPVKVPTTPTPPTVKTTTTPPTTAPNGMPLDTLHGTIQNGQLQTIVWAGLSPSGPLYPVALMVDTGAQDTMVSGNFWKAMGDQPTGQPSSFSGIGGSETVQWWPNVWVYPQDKPINPIIAGGTEPGGINRSVLGPEGIIILLGQNIISTGTLTQDGNYWTLKYPVQ